MRLPIKSARHSFTRNLQVYPLSGQLVNIVSIAANAGYKENKGSVRPEAVPRLTNVCLGFDGQESWAQRCNNFQTCCQQLGGHTWWDGNGNRHDC